MKKQLKKIIAREFLFMLFGLLLISFTIGGFYYLREDNKSAIEALRKKSSVSSLSIKKEELFKYLREKGFDKNETGTKSEFLSLLNEEENRINLFKYLIDDGINADTLDKYGLNQIIIKNKMELNKKEINFLSRVSVDDFNYYMIMGTFLLLFIGRYFIYATKWSIIQLKH